MDFSGGTHGNLHVNKSDSRCRRFLFAAFSGSSTGNSATDGRARRTHGEPRVSPLIRIAPFASACHYVACKKWMAREWDYFCGIESMTYRQRMPRKPVDGGRAALRASLSLILLLADADITASQWIEAINFVDFGGKFISKIEFRW